MLTDRNNDRRTDAISIGVLRDITPDWSVGLGARFLGPYGGDQTQKYVHHALKGEHVDLPYDDSAWRPLLFISNRHEWRWLDPADSFHGFTTAGYLVSTGTTWDQIDAEATGYFGVGSPGYNMLLIGGYRQSLGHAPTATADISGFMGEGWFFGFSTQAAVVVFQLRVQQHMPMAILGIAF